MQIDKFEYVLAIANEKNITKAAQKLYISQPALTVYINKLESELRVKLFDRSSNPIKVTYAGEQYINYMTNIQKLYSKMLKEMQLISSNHKGALTLAITNTRGEFWLPYIIPVFLKQRPDIDLRIVEGTNSEFEEKLVDLSVDIAIMPLPIYSSGILYETIQDEIIMLVIPQNSPILHDLDTSNNSLSNLLKISPDRLNNQCFLCPDQGYGLNRITYYMFEKYGIQPGEVKTINNSDTAFHLACNGFGLCFTPICSAFPPMPSSAPVYCTLDDPPYIRKIVAAYNRNSVLSDAAKDLIRIAQNVVNTNPALKMPF